MGIREQGYRHWEGQYSSHAFRWWTIAKQGIRATIFSRLRLTFILIFIALVCAPFLIFGIISIATGGQDGDAGFECYGRARDGPDGRGDVFPTQNTLLRCNMWDLLRGWQFLIVPPFIALVAAPLVSTDLRSNALYIYLSKPLRRIDYIIGKMVAVAMWGLAVTVLPALIMWFLALAAQTEFSQLTAKYEILFELLAVQLLFLILVSMLILAISSFTKNWPAAMLSFLGTWLGLWIVANILVDTTKVRAYYYISPVDNLINFAQDAFEIAKSTPAGWPSFLIVFGLIALATGAFFWRILRIEVAE